MDRLLLARRLAWLAIALAVAAVYGSSLDAPFVYDDKIEVIGNRTIRLLEEWRAVVGYNVSRPLLILSYAWNFSRAGLDPFEYHLTNIAVHVLAVGAALELAVAGGRLFEVRRPLGVGAVAVGLWAIHPMATESVTYTTGRSETLCAAFAFLSLAAWAVAIRREGEGSSGVPWRLGGLLAFVGAAASKEVGWLVPLAALALEVIAARARPAPANGGLGRRRWAWYLPFALVLGLAVALRLRFAGELLPREVDRPLAVQLTTSAEVWLHYVRLWLVPVGQTLFHHQPDLSPLSARGALAILGWLGLVGGGVALGRRRPAAGWALLAGALLLLPSSSFVPLKETMAEHRAYQAGLFLLLAIGWALPRAALRPAAVVAALAAPALAFSTVARNEVWGSEVRLWQEATRRRPEIADAWYGLGDAHRFAKQFGAAREAYRRAAELDPSHLDAWNNLGIAAAEVGDVEEARRAWREALRVRPSYCKAHNNLGSLAYRRQDWDLAVTELRSTLAYCPDSVIAHYLLGNIHYGPRRDKERATFHYERVVELAPHFDHAPLVKERLLELTW